MNRIDLTCSAYLTGIVNGELEASPTSPISCLGRLRHLQKATRQMRPETAGV